MDSLKNNEQQLQNSNPPWLLGDLEDYLNWQTTLATTLQLAAVLFDGTHIIQPDLEDDEILVIE